MFQPVFDDQRVTAKKWAGMEMQSTSTQLEALHGDSNKK